MSDDVEEPDNSAPSSAVMPLRTGRRVVASVASGAGNTILVAGLGAFAIRFITIHLGKLSFGSFVTALTFVTTAMLIADLGITAITGREIAAHPDRASEILGHNLGLRVTISVAMIPAVILLGLVLYHGKQSELLWSIAIVALAIPFDAMRTTSLGYFVSSIRTYYGSAVTLLQQVLYVSGIVVAIQLHRGIVGCAVSYLVAGVIAGGVAFALTRREIHFRPLFNARQWRAVISQSISLGAIWAVNLLYLKADTLLLSRMSTLSNVGLYGVSYSFITFFSVVPSLIMTSLIPLLTRATASELPHLVRRAEQVLGAVGVLLAAGTIVFAPQAIAALSGHQFLAAATSLRILAVATIFTFLNSGLGYAAVAKNRHHSIIYVSVAGLVLNVAANVIAIPRWKIDGAATATLISEVVTLVGVWYFYRRDVDPKTTLMRALIRPLIAGGVVVAFTHAVLVTTWNAPTRTLLWAPVFAALYVLVLGLLGGLPEDVRRLIGRTRFVPYRRGGLGEGDLGG